ncbi:MAG: RnfABCDGE type electron transport complex subunit D [Candidatus Aenigmarchaeota archaeon]|nr:RnfABCDGE type electron transport complex subunit D [Candidatus Aenigmarchaeota archaeon]
MTLNKITTEHWVSAFLVITLAYSYVISPSDGKLYQIIIAPAVAVVLDAVIYKIRQKRLEFPWLGLITGLIIAALMAPNILLAAVIPAAAIILKHVIKFRGRNVFNPAALGLLIATFLGAFASWWAVSFLVIPFGLIAVYKTRRYYNAAAFLVLYYILSAARGSAFLLDYAALFFALIMVIEPVTTPSAKKGQIAFGAAVAVLSTALAVYTRIDFFLLSLLLMNLFSYRLNRFR